MEMQTHHPAKENVMSKFINAIAIAALATGIFIGNAALARSTDEGLEAIQPKGHGPQTVLGALPDICATACTDTTDQPVRPA